MSYKNSIQAIQMTSFNTNALAVTYKPINSSGLTEACYLIRIINDSNIDVTISFDGVTANDYVRTGETLELAALSVPNSSSSNLGHFRQGTVVSVKGTGAGAGYIYLSGYYQPFGI